MPARVLATVMLLQAFEGLSDREAVDHLEVDLRWQAACGVDTGAEAFHSTVLVGQRNRLRASARPRRLFEDVKVVAQTSGALQHRARVFDSTPIYDAVATQDTVTQLRAVIRKLLIALDATGERELSAAVRSSLAREDDYASPGKPPCDWDDRAAREQLVDELVSDCHAALEVLGRLDAHAASSKDASELLALVAGQDVEEGEDGVFRIARKVAKDRVISTVDPEARHGHKSKSRRFDGFKLHVSLDPDSELIDDVVVTPANTPDRDAVPALVEPLLERDEKPEIVGDAAYGDGATRAALEEVGITVMARVPPVRNTTGGFTKDRFVVDLDASTVTCPAAQTVAIRFFVERRGRGPIRCPLRELSPREPVHHVTTRKKHHRPSPRGITAAGPRRTARPRVVGSLPGRSSDGRTQDRSLCSSGLGRATSAHPRTETRRNRSRHAELARSTWRDWRCSDSTFELEWLEHRGDLSPTGSPSSFRPTNSSSRRFARVDCSPRFALRSSINVALTHHDPRDALTSAPS